MILKLKQEFLSIGRPLQVRNERAEANVTTTFKRSSWVDAWVLCQRFGSIVLVGAVEFDARRTGGAESAHLHVQMMVYGLGWLAHPPPQNLVSAANTGLQVLATYVL